MKQSKIVGKLKCKVVIHDAEKVLAQEELDGDWYVDGVIGYPEIKVRRYRFGSWRADKIGRILHNIQYIVERDI